MCRHDALPLVNIAQLTAYDGLRRYWQLVVASFAGPAVAAGSHCGAMLAHQGMHALSRLKKAASAGAAASRPA